MRSSLRVGLAALLAGSALIGAASTAFAGADDGGNKAFWLPSTTSNAATSDTRDMGQYTARYAPQSAVQSKATPDKDPPGYYHAMGTMGVP